MGDTTNWGVPTTSFSIGTCKSKVLHRWGGKNLPFQLFSSTKVERVLDKVEQAIIEGRRLVAKIDAMLQQAEEFNQRYGFEPEELKRYMRENLSPAEREAVDRQVKEAIREVHEEAECAVESLKATSRPTRKFRSKIIV